MVNEKGPFFLNRRIMPTYRSYQKIVEVERKALVFANRRNYLLPALTLLWYGSRPTILFFR